MEIKAKIEKPYTDETPGHDGTIQPCNCFWSTYGI